MINSVELMFYSLIFYPAFGLAHDFMLCDDLWNHILCNARQFTSCFYIPVTFMKYVAN